MFLKTSSAVALGMAASVCLGQTPAPQQSLPNLTLQQAEAAAVQNHPRIQAAQHEINFANQQITEARAAYYPEISADATGSQGNDLSRLGAGSISASRLFSRVGGGVSIQQLISDFGRTSNLVATSRLEAEAAAQNAGATRYDVLLQVNRAYFNVLRAQAVVDVAEKTVAARQLVDDQVNAYARNQLRSQLDASFADEQVTQAKVLLIDAQDAVQEALAQLGRTMGLDQPANYKLMDEPLPSALPATPDPLIAQALSSRPELAGLRFSRDASYKFAQAEKDLAHPTVSAVGVGGYIPYINTPPTAPIPSGYEGIAANVSIPVFNGHLFSARATAANERALESDQRLRDEQQSIERDVRVAWATAHDAFQRIDLTAQILRTASLAETLAEGRYNLGLSSIVELTQAQLDLTRAQIDNLNAKYDYQTQYQALQYTIGLLR